MAALVFWPIIQENAGMVNTRATILCGWTAARRGHTVVQAICALADHEALALELKKGYHREPHLHPCPADQGGILDRSLVDKDNRCEDTPRCPE
jgi:hypothetical protein